MKHYSINSCRKRKINQGLEKGKERTNKKRKIKKIDTKKEGGKEKNRHVTQAPLACGGLECLIAPRASKQGYLTCPVYFLLLINVLSNDKT